MTNVQVIRTAPYGQLPTKATSRSAGYDLYSAEYVTLSPGEYRAVGTGISLDMSKLPDTVGVEVRPRSGMAANSGVTILNAPGTIDLDYTGEIKVVLINHSQDVYLVGIGDRIAQLVFTTNASKISLRSVDDMAREETLRLRLTGDRRSVRQGGFGSTGR